MYLILRSLYSIDWIALNILKGEMCCGYRYLSQQQINRRAYTCTQFAVSACVWQTPCLKGTAGMLHNAFFCMSCSENLMWIIHRSSMEVIPKSLCICFPASVQTASMMHLLSKITQPIGKFSCFMWYFYHHKCISSLSQQR